MDVKPKQPKQPQKPRRQWYRLDLNDPKKAREFLNWTYQQPPIEWCYDDEEPYTVHAKLNVFDALRWI